MMTTKPTIDHSNSRHRTLTPSPPYAHIQGRIVLTRMDGYTIAHVHRTERTLIDQLFTDHYLATMGNSGFAHAVFDPQGNVVGGTLIGQAPSKLAARSLITEPWPVWCLKRSFARDDCPVEESQMIRSSIKDTANLLQRTIAVVSYADPAAVDTRTGNPLLGWTYLASGFFFVGWTKQQRWAVVDLEGRARSPRQGPITLKPAQHCNPPARLEDLQDSASQDLGRDRDA